MKKLFTGQNWNTPCQKIGIIAGFFVVILTILSGCSSDGSWLPAGYYYNPAYQVNQDAQYRRQQQSDAWAAQQRQDERARRDFEEREFRRRQLEALEGIQQNTAPRRYQ
jgi:hypothetical protein